MEEKADTSETKRICTPVYVVIRALEILRLWCKSICQSCPATPSTPGIEGMHSAKKNALPCTAAEGQDW